MSTEAEVILVGDEAPLKSSLQRARDDMNRFGEEAMQPFAKLRDAMGNLGNIMMGFGAVRLTQLADEAALIQARIKDVAGNFVEAHQAQQQLFASAQRLQVGYADLAGSFSKMLPAVKEMGGGANEAVRLAEMLATTARLSGASAQEASASAQQFAQALQSGVLQGDELKSIMENNGSLARLLADGLGVSAGELKKLGSEGKLTSDKVAEALLGQYDKISARSAELPQTVGGAWTQITNSFQQFIAKANEGTGVFGGLASVMSGLARLIDAVRVAFEDTGSEADKLNRNNSIKAWGESVGAILAYVVDLTRAVWEAFTAVGRGIGALAAAAAQAAQGNFSGAAQVMRDAVADAEKSWEKIKNLGTGGEGSTLRSYALNDGQAAPDTTTGAKLKSKGKTGKDKKDKADPSQMGEWEAKLGEEKAYLSEHGDLLDQAKAYELAYWQNILDTAKVSEADKVAIRKKMAALRTEISAAEAKSEAEIEKDSLETWKQVENLKIDHDRLLAKQQLDQGKITKAQMIDAEIEFEERRYQVTVDYLRRRQALNPENKAGQAKTDNDILVAGMQRDNKVTDLQGQKKTAGYDWEGMFKGIGSSASSGFGQILKSAQTWQQAMYGVFNGVRDVFLKAVVLEPMKAQIASWAKLLAMKMGFIGQEQALDATASAATVATKAAETTAVTSANAVQAGTAAAASQAAIPVVGPGLALAAMGSVFAAVLALGGKMKSARNGFDIPAGLNPVTQLHEEEMVLPKEQANVIRDMANGGGGGGGFSPVVKVSAMDSRSVAQALRQGGALEKALRSLHRDFVRI